MVSRNYLQGQSYNWSAPPLQICYSLYLRFNATTDPLTDGQDPCEYTSADALGKAIASTFDTLDSERIVSGRVDIVAHSMGGLVLRNYAALRDMHRPEMACRDSFTRS
jgi:pimeloyl-ACP methyl ester carboxylesterase